MVFSTIFKDCISCQTKALRLDMHIDPHSDFAETAEGLNQCNSRDTKGPRHPSSKENSYVFVICDAFTQNVTIKPSPQSDAEAAADVFSKNLIIVFGSLKTLVPDECSEYFNIVNINI